MYHPYFRGKQYELIAIRENAERLAASDFVPIVEPVKQALSGLGRALTSVGDAGGSIAVIVNPNHGDHSDGGERIVDFLQNEQFEGVNISPAILLTENCEENDVIRLCNEFQTPPLTLVHAGYPRGESLAERLRDRVNIAKQVFFEDNCGRLYRRHFPSQNRILLRDGFERRRNRDHPPVEFFSDLHVTFEEESMTGFGDFLTVGDDYSESGGPAYAIAIHLTFIDPDRDDAMFIRHFLSDRQDTPTDPAGKFAEALSAMIDVLDNNQSPILETDAIREFRQLHADKHYPGLGYAKKLSMQHHIETLSAYFRA